MQQYYGDMPHIIPKNRKKVKNKRGLGRIIVNFLCLLVVVFSIYCLFSALLYPTKNSEKYTKIHNRVWFFVTLNEKTLEEIKQSGGSGMEVNGHKVASVYDTESDAKIVADRIGGGVYSYSVNELNVAEENGNLVNLLDFYLIAYSDLSKIIEECSTGAPVSAVTFALGSLKNKCSTVKSSIVKDDEVTAEIFNYISKIETDIERVVEASEQNNLSMLWELCCETVYERGVLSRNLSGKIA